MALFDTGILGIIFVARGQLATRPSKPLMPNPPGRGKSFAASRTSQVMREAAPRVLSSPPFSTARAQKASKHAEDIRANCPEYSRS
jgi:hypothetical protein